jgi:outer membrane protein TolC
VADDTRRAWYAAVAAQQSADYMDQVKTAAEASAELARRMAQAGNWSRLQQRASRPSTPTRGPAGACAPGQHGGT